MTLKFSGKEDKSCTHSLEAKFLTLLHMSRLEDSDAFALKCASNVDVSSTAAFYIPACEVKKSYCLTERHLYVSRTI